MNDSPAVAFDQLSECDLVLDRIYKGGAAGNTADDPLGKLLPGVGNQGGFRPMGRLSRDAVRLVVLYTSGVEPDWPDELDPYTGAFTYFGDNRSPGRELHDTPRSGNLLLRTVFERAHSGQAGRAKVPPFLLFDKPGTGRDVRFRGLLAPGSDRTNGEEDLVAVWRTTKGQRFQNYRARFTVLETASITRSWVTELAAGEPLGPGCPPAWRSWVETGRYLPLQAPPTVITRSREDQEPDPADKPLISCICQHFKDRKPTSSSSPPIYGAPASPTSTRSTSPGPGATAAVMLSATTSSARAPTPSRSSSPWKPNATHPAAASASARRAG